MKESLLLFCTYWCNKLNRIKKKCFYGSFCCSFSLILGRETLKIVQHIHHCLTSIIGRHIICESVLFMEFSWKNVRWIQLIERFLVTNIVNKDYYYLFIVILRTEMIRSIFCYYKSKFGWDAWNSEFLQRIWHLSDIRYNSVYNSIF